MSGLARGRPLTQDALIWGKRGFVVVLIAALLAAAAPAPTPAVVDAAKPETVIAALQDAGYKAVLKKDGSGDPLITSAASGANFNVYFYGCEQGAGCRSLQLYAAYTVKPKLTADKVNGWNRENRFGTALLDKDGDPALQWDVITETGMPEPLFAQMIDRWAGAMASYQTYVGW